MNSNKNSTKSNSTKSSTVKSSSNMVIYLVLLLLLVIIIGVVLYFFVFKKKDGTKKKYKCAPNGACIESKDGTFDDNKCGGRRCEQKYFCNSSTGQCNLIEDKNYSGSMYDTLANCSARCNTGQQYYCATGSGNTRMCLPLTDNTYTGDKYSSSNCEQNCPVKYYCKNNTCTKVENVDQVGTLYDNDTTCSGNCAASNTKYRCDKQVTGFTCVEDNTSNDDETDCNSKCVTPDSCKTQSVNAPKTFTNDNKGCVCPDGFEGDNCGERIVFGSGDKVYWQMTERLGSLVIEPPKN